MDVRESISVAADAIRSNKFRSFLTVLGIIIGVWAVIGVVTFTSGLTRSVSEQLTLLGGGTFYVDKFPAIANRDAERFRNRKDITLPQVQAVQQKGDLLAIVSPEINSVGTIKYRDKKTNPTVFFFGANEFWGLANNYFVEEGRFLTALDVQRRAPTAIVGVEVVERLFPFEDPIGKEIRLDGKRFKIAGVFEEKGQLFGQSQDNIAVIPITTFEKYFGSRRSINFAVKAKDPALTSAAIEQVTGIMRSARKVAPGKPNDFEILTRDSLMETWDNLTRNIFLAAMVIAGMALLVGGIGIMNIMMVSVTERTREIGIRKAVGASRQEIKWQFITEAIILSGVGGVLGVILGILSGTVIGLAINWPTSIPVVASIVGFCFATAVGLFFGIYPAVKASRLNPIEALRYE